MPRNDLGINIHNRDRQYCFQRERGQSRHSLMISSFPINDGIEIQFLYQLK